VVASEVRALAQRSSQAAREIKSLIGASSEHVDAGVKFVGQSGDALRQIVGQIIEINELVTEIAQAASQQSTGIEEVNAAVNQMDQVTQQNAAMVEEATAAAHHLSAEAQNLAGLVTNFNVGVSLRGVRAAAEKPKPAVRTARVPRGNAAVAVQPEPAADDWTEF
jgi:methyl-accepting chemotaxis protein